AGDPDQTTVGEKALRLIRRRFARAASRHHPPAVSDAVVVLTRPFEPRLAASRVAPVKPVTFCFSAQVEIPPHAVARRGWFGQTPSLNGSAPLQVQGRTPRRR